MDSESQGMVPDPKRRNPIRILLQGYMKREKKLTICRLYLGKSLASSK